MGNWQYTLAGDLGASWVRGTGAAELVDSENNRTYQDFVGMFRSSEYFCT
jgi:hypothetical protein